MVLAPPALLRCDREGLTDLSDESLVRRVAARDATSEDALAELYDRYATAVHRLGVRLLGDASQAEHLVQETFWRVWQHAGRYETGRVRWSTWLLRLARNKAISELRAAGCRPRPIGRTGLTSADGPSADETALEVQDRSPDVAEIVWGAERRRLIRSALARLPVEQRQALELAYFGGLTHREFAQTQAAPPSTVKTRLALGLRKMAHELGGCGLEAGAY
jgi:RNA polymerase sigma-70 factor, ECF subfamily